MEKFKFTEPTLRNLRWKGIKQYDEYQDVKIPNLFVRISKKNIPTFFVYGRIKGVSNPTRQNIGKYGEISLEDARIKAKEIVSIWGKGLNPGEEKKKNKQANITLAQCFEDYRTSRTLKKSTLYDYERSMKTTFADWQNLPLNRITSEMVIEHYNKISKNTPGLANLHFRCLHAVFEFATERYCINGTRLISYNPVSVLKKLKIMKTLKPRKFIIKPEQLPLFFEVTTPKINDSYQLRQTKIQCLILLFTGCREQEIASLKCHNIDFKDRTITIETTKNGKELTIPFADYLNPIFSDLCKGKQPNDYIFPANNRTGHLKDISKTVKKISSTLGFHFSPHVCHHTFQTYAMKLKIHPYVMKQLVNHSSGASGDVTLDYISVDIDSQREAIDSIERFILNNANITRDATVIKFPKVNTGIRT